MHTKLEVAAASVIGARHARAGRNGQDAAAAWSEGERGVVVVCDGCGSGASSEVGARLGAQLVIAAGAARLRAGEEAAAIWAGVRAEVVAELARLVERMPGDRAQAVHDHFLFTIVAAAWDAGGVAVWAVGDGAYAFGARVTVLGPFVDNQPPYVAYDLLGMPAAAHLEVADRACGFVMVATDGVAEVGLDELVHPAARERFLAHPDALRRQLAVLARADERIDWDAQRVERTPARLQDDGAVALGRWAKERA